MGKKCPNCGSEDISLFIGGQSGQYKCNECGYIGVMIIEEEK